MSEFAAALATLPSFSREFTERDVDRALASKVLGLEEFAALISPAASRRIEQIAHAAHERTLRRFGRTVHMYAPIYLSNECLTTCTYCGFAKDLAVVRKTLSTKQSVSEALALKERGFRSLLLLTGEHQRLTGVDFLCDHLEALARHIPNLSIEVQVWDEHEYARLKQAGCDGVVVYQETYNRDSYKRFHLAGRKRDFDWRIGALERAARAGVRRLGLGALLGLHEPWREDAIATAAHAQFLQKYAWRSEITVSLPRIRPSASGYAPKHPITDIELALLVCALRLMFADVGIVMSSREEASYRDGLIRLGVTHTSAGSRAEPEGYSHPGEAESQFEICDTRSAEEVAHAIREMGYEPVWKDWDAGYRVPEPV